jgi:CheY-like chemotaxis protein
MGKRILVADDDPAILEVLQIMLEDDGYVVETVAESLTVARVEASRPDLILLDIRLPGPDGGEICRQLKERETTRHIPLIVMSASRDAQRLADECGADAFLPKPFELDDLLDLVRRHTEERPRA